MFEKQGHQEQRHAERTRHVQSRMFRSVFILFGGRARDVSTGLCYVSFAAELALLNSAIFMRLVISRIVRLGFDFSQATRQTGSGSLVRRKLAVERIEPSSCGS